jgi:hypothetical protein
MKLFIPSLSTKLILTQPWTFHLFYESRNRLYIEKLRECYKIPEPPKSIYHEPRGLGEFTLPVGTTLSVSRIYIRLGQKEFDSVTFTINYETFSPRRQKNINIKGRCWVKLEDANKIEADIVPGT